MGVRRLLRRRALVRDVLEAGRRSSAPFWATTRDAFFRPRRVAGFRSREPHSSGARACCLAPVLASRASLLHALGWCTPCGRHRERRGAAFWVPPLSHPRRCASQGDALEARPQVCSPRTRLEPAAALTSTFLGSRLWSLWSQSTCVDSGLQRRQQRPRRRGAQQQTAAVAVAAAWRRRPPTRRSTRATSRRRSP